VQSNIESGYVAFPFLYNNIEKPEVMANAVNVMQKNKILENNFKTFVLVNKMMEVSKKDLFRHYENVETARLGAAQKFDNDVERIINNDQREENLKSINERLGFTKAGSNLIDYRNDKLVLVLKYKDLSEKDAAKQIKDYTIEIGKMKTSAEELWARDSEYDNLSQTTMQTFADMLSYDLQPSLYEKYKTDKSVLFNYSKILFQTPMR
jgi:hypothetical protein